MTSRFAIIAGAAALAFTASAASAFPGAGSGSAATGASAHSNIVLAHGFHRSCEEGRFGWHRSTRFGRDVCAPPRRFRGWGHDHREHGSREYDRGGDRGGRDYGRDRGRDYGYGRDRDVRPSVGRTPVVVIPAPIIVAPNRGPGNGPRTGDTTRPSRGDRRS